MSKGCRSMRIAVVIFLSASAVAISGCGDDDSATQMPRWYAGDLHVHSSVGSNDTRYPDGSALSLPETIRDVAVERGLSFVVVTDHSNSTGSLVDTTVEDATLWNLGPEFPLWETAADLSTETFLMIDGNEISPVSTLTRSGCPDCPTLGTGRLTPVGHIGCVPSDLASFDISGVIVDRPPGEVTGGTGIDDCQARGGFAIVNHPLPRATPWIAYDWTNYDYDAIEVFNGTIGWDVFDLYAYDAYLCDRLQGRDVVAVGGSDNHRTPIPYDDDVGVQLGAPLALPATSVLASELTWPAIMAGMRAGRIVVHELGSFVDLTIESESGERAGVGGALPSAGEATVTLRGRSETQQDLRLYAVAPDACTDRREVGRDVPPTVTKTIAFSASVCATGPCEFEESATVDLEPGLYFATLGDFNTAGVGVRGAALTNVIEVALE